MPDLVTPLSSAASSSRAAPSAPGVEGDAAIAIAGMNTESSSKDESASKAHAAAVRQTDAAVETEAAANAIDPGAGSLDVEHELKSVAVEMDARRDAADADRGEAEGKEDDKADAASCDAAQRAGHGGNDSVDGDEKHGQDVTADAKHDTEDGGAGDGKMVQSAELLCAGEVECAVTGVDGRAGDGSASVHETNTEERAVEDLNDGNGGCDGNVEEHADKNTGAENDTTATINDLPAAAALQKITSSVQEETRLLEDEGCGGRGHVAHTQKDESRAEATIVV